MHGTDLYGLCNKLSNGPRETQNAVELLKIMANVDPVGFDNQIRAMEAAVAAAPA